MPRVDMMAVFRPPQLHQTLFRHCTPTGRSLQAMPPCAILVCSSSSHSGSKKVHELLSVSVSDLDASRPSHAWSDINSPAQQVLEIRVHSISWSSFQHAPQIRVRSHYGTQGGPLALQILCLQSIASIRAAQQPMHVHEPLLIHSPPRNQQAFTSSS